MLITFDELRIDPTEYNGWTFAKLRAEYIQIAADWLCEYYGAFDYELFCHYDWDINHVCRTITIPRNAIVH